MLYISGQNILPKVYMSHCETKMTAKAKFTLSFTVHMGTSFFMAS